MGETGGGGWVIDCIALRELYNLRVGPTLWLTVKPYEFTLALKSYTIYDSGQLRTGSFFARARRLSKLS